MAAKLHTEPGDQAALGKKVGIGTHLAFVDQFESGAQPGTENRVELERQPPFECLVEQAQRDVLEGMEFGPPGRKVTLVEFGTDPFAQKNELAGY